MSKVRINELARELEVKPSIILEMLPELGVADKKTHSSSLDDEVAVAIKRRLAGEEDAVPVRTSERPETAEEEIPVAPAQDPKPAPAATMEPAEHPPVHTLPVAPQVPIPQVHASLPSVAETVEAPPAPLRSQPL